MKRAVVPARGATMKFSVPFGSHLFVNLVVNNCCFLFQTLVSSFLTLSLLVVAKLSLHFHEQMT